MSPPPSSGFWLLTLFMSVCSCTLSIAAPKHQPPLPPSPGQLEAMQTREFDSEFEVVYHAILSTLQDEGWIIEVATKESGLIQASSLKTQGEIGPEGDWKIELGQKKLLTKQERIARRMRAWTRWQTLTARIEPWEEKTTRVRISIVKLGSIPTMQRQKGGGIFSSGRPHQPSLQQSAIQSDPTVYQLIYQKIGRSVFIREGLTSEVPGK